MVVLKVPESVIPSRESPATISMQATVWLESLMHLDMAFHVFLVRTALGAVGALERGLMVSLMLTGIRLAIAGPRSWEVSQAYFRSPTLAKVRRHPGTSHVNMGLSATGMFTSWRIPDRESFANVARSGAI